MTFSRTFAFVAFVASLAPLSLSAPSKVGSVETRTTSLITVDAHTCSTLESYGIYAAEVIAKDCANAKLISATGHHKLRRDSISATSSFQLNVCLNMFNTCNSVTQQLTNVIGGSASLVSGLTSGLVVPILQNLKHQMDATVSALGNVVACTDAAVAATVYNSFKLYAQVHTKLFVFIAANANSLEHMNLKATVHKALVDVDSSLNAYLRTLFTYISKDLDNLGLQASLTSSLHTAIAACA